MKKNLCLNACKSVLAICLAYFPLSISASPRVLSSISASKIAQTVSGVVRDAKGEVVVGASVVEKGTTNGTSTDVAGKYELTYSSSNPTLVFSAVGFQTQEVFVGARSQISVTLQESSITLEGFQVVGSRSINRSSTETPVAVDVMRILDENPRPLGGG